MAQAFFGGVHPHDMKAATNEKAIEQLAPPATVVIPMSMHFGAPCTPIVKVGENAPITLLPAWLEREKGTLKGTVAHIPTREEIDTPVEEHLIVELYSK